MIRNGYNGCFVLPPATEGIHLMDGSLVFNNNGYELKKKCTTKELEKFRFRYRNGTFYVSPRSGNGTRGDTLLKSNCGAQSGFKEVLMDASAGVTLRQPCSGQIENQGVSIFVHNIPVIFDDKNVTIDGSEISDQPWMLGGNWTSKETEELVEDTKKMAMSNDLVFDAGIGFYPTVAALRGGPGHPGECGGSAGNSLRIPVRHSERHCHSCAGDVRTLPPRGGGRRT